jgi:arylsulfatase A-like enzyme
MTLPRHLVALAGVCLLTVAPAHAQSPIPSPNIVFIMADDLGYGDIGPFGQTKIHTPRLDAMAREGTRFTSFYAGSPVCAPSRSTLMTGQHTGHTPIRGNKEAQPLGQLPLPDDAVTLAEVLKARGYATGGFGKWGMGDSGTEGVPTKQGFDEFFGYLDQRRAHFYYPEFLIRGEERVPLPNRVKEEPRSPGAGPATVRAVFSEDTIVGAALSFIDRHKEGPFFLYLPFTIPHAELQPPQDAFAPYLRPDGSSIFPETPFPGPHYGAQAMPHAAYAAAVSRMDRDVGRVLDRLKELGLDDNTLVIFTSDNGPSIEGGSDPEFFASSGPYRGHKRDVYEGGIREPMIARWPGRVPAGATSDHVWAMWDVFPTFAALAGAKVHAGIDGLDMTAALTGKGTAPQHDHLYWEFHELGGKQAVRRGNWKAVRLGLIKNPDAPVELYDLSTDPGETRDLAAQHPDVARELKAIMVREHVDSTLFPDLNAIR